MKRRLVHVLALTALAPWLAGKNIPLAPPRDFTCWIDLDEMGDFHTPKGGSVPITLRNGMLADIDLSVDPEHPVGTDHLRNVTSLDISKSIENGNLTAKALLAYPPPNRAEMELKLSAFLGPGSFTFKATEIKRRYGVYSSISDPEFKLQEEKITTFFFNGSAEGWKNGKYIFKGPYRRVTRFRRFTGSTGWREDKPRITEYTRTKSVKPIGRSGLDDSPAWYQGAYLKAFGTGNGNTKEDLHRVDGFFTSTASTVQKGTLDLARQQIDQLAGMLKDLRDDIQQTSSPITVQVFRLPTGEALDQIRELQRLELELRELHQQAYAHVDQLIQDIEAAKLNFSGNVIKGMFRSYLSWSGSLPTDPVDGFAGYSLPTRLFALPGSLSRMLENAETDSDFLASQVNAIRAMEALQAFWEKVRDHAVSEHRRLESHLKTGKVEAMIQLHKHASSVLQ